eukprot:TRINITY_DN5818_c1_g2_i1.p1 TRINITY_DN5818_c1_g2~~TRINITY_DN5818_c1_g2_i1.p1  ORF type:complete len:1065 (+),score=579.29 TRINITY_DN5818_c1_g2_i1:36-3197(+)
MSEEAVKHLALVLDSTLSNSNQIREDGEKAFNQLAIDPLFPTVTFTLIKNYYAQVSPSVLLQAATSLKNYVSGGWCPFELVGSNLKMKESKIPNEAKQLIREGIVETICTVGASVPTRNQLAEVLKTVVSFDYPDHMPNLLQTLSNLLTSRNEMHMEVSLVCLLALFRKYEFAAHEDKEGAQELAQEYFHLINLTFPTLFDLFRSLQQNDSLVSARLQQALIKIFYTATHVVLPPNLVHPEAIVPWMEILIAIYLKPIPEEVIPKDKDDWKHFPWFIAKKWAIKTFTRLFQRYGTPENNDDALQVQFAKVFVSTFAPIILDAVFKTLTAPSSSVFRPILNQSLIFLQTSLRYSITFKVMNNFGINNILSQLLFPVFCCTEDDVIMFDEDPQEYVRRESDIGEEYYDPISTAESVMLEIIRLRGTKKYLPPFVQFLEQQLAIYNSNPQQYFNLKFGVLDALENLAPILNSEANYKQSMENVIASHVVTELRNQQFAILRAKACRTLSSFWNAKFTSQDAYQHIVKAILDCTRDPELPVRVNAANALKLIIQTPEAQSLLKPYLRDVLFVFFELMKEVENDELVSSLDTLIATFEEDIPPYAIEICQNLTNSFLRIVAEADEEDDLAAMTAVECLKSIQTVLGAVIELPDLYHQLEGVLFPLIRQSLTIDCLEYFDDVLKIVMFLTHVVKPLSDRLWSLFPIITSCYLDWAIDYAPSFVAPLDNYISYGTEQFIQNGGMDQIMMMYSKSLTDFSTYNERSVCDSSIIAGSQIIEVTLVNCTGKIDQYIPTILELAINRLDHAAEFSVSGVCTVLFDVIASCLFYNPILFFTFLESKQGLTTHVFRHWFETLPIMAKNHDRKISALAFSRILEIPTGNFPQSIKDAYAQIVSSTIKLLVDIRQHPEDEEDLDDDENEPDGGDALKKALALIGGGSKFANAEDFDHLIEDEEAVEYGSDEDFDDEGLEEMKKALAGLTGGGFAEEDNEVFTSPIDHINEIDYFFARMEDLFAREPAVFSHVKGTFGESEEKGIEFLKTVNAAIKEAEQQQQQEQGHQ